LKLKLKDDKDCKGGKDEPEGEKISAFSTLS